MEAVGNSWDILTPSEVTDIRRIIQSESYEANKIKVNIQGGCRKFLGHLICHYRSRILVINIQTGSCETHKPISTKSEFYSTFLFFIVCIILSNIRSGSRICGHFPSADVSKTNLSCAHPFPNAAFIRYIWPCLSDWDDICGTKCV